MRAKERTKVYLGPTIAVENCWQGSQKEPRDRGQPPGRGSCAKGDV